MPQVEGDDNSPQQQPPADLTRRVVAAAFELHGQHFFVGQLGVEAGSAVALAEVEAVFAQLEVRGAGKVAVLVNHGGADAGA